MERALAECRTHAPLFCNFIAVSASFCAHQEAAVVHARRQTQDSCDLMCARQELVLSQRHVRRLLDLCVRHLSASPAQPVPGQTQRASQEASLVKGGFTQAMRHVIMHSPETLVALGLKPLRAALGASLNVKVTHRPALYLPPIFNVPQPAKFALVCHVSECMMCQTMRCGTGYILQRCDF
jgi:hypothetical protein